MHAFPCAEIVARVGVYQVSSSNPSHLSLLPFALSTPADGLPTMSAQGADHHTSGSRMLSRTNAEGEATGSQLDTHPRPSIEALRDSLFLITLDWEVPWTFLSQLIEWLDVVRDVVESAAGTNKSSWSRERAVWDEMKEALETSIRTYADLSGTAGPLVDEDDGEVGNMSSASALVAVSNPAAVEGEEDSPLPEGCLTHNLGVPLVVVCTKADTIVQLERERNFKEEQFDYIQQVLRTICLKCECWGARVDELDTADISVRVGRWRRSLLHGAVKAGFVRSAPLICAPSPLQPHRSHLHLPIPGIDSRAGRPAGPGWLGQFREDKGTARWI